MAPHPIMYDEDDPVFQRVRGLALAYPGADMKVSHGRPAFFTKKIFATYGGSIRHGKEDWEQRRQSLLVLPADDAEREALLQSPQGFAPAYWGPWGWVGIDLDTKTDWDEIDELLDASYRLTAGKRLIAQLDAE